MKRLLAVLVVAVVGLAGCCHVYDLYVQGHKITQLGSYDLIGPSTVGYYESVDGKLVLHQQAAGSAVGEIAIGLGTGYAGERVGDGLKHQEADQTNVSNASESVSEGGEGGAGGFATGGNATGGNATGGRASVGPVNSVSGAAAGAVSNSSATGFRGYKPAVKPATKPAVKPVSVKPATNQSVSVRNTINNNP